MRRVFTEVSGVCGLVVLSASLALASEGAGKPPDYSGITHVYYAVIAFVLGYGVYDTFFKKS